jgi:GAF domain-containing protein
MRLAELQELTATLSRAATLEDVASVAITAGMRHLHADAVIACVLDESRSRWEVDRHVGLEPVMVEAWLTLPMDGSTPVGQALRHGRLVALESQHDRIRRFPALAAAPSPHEMAVVAPMTAESGRAEGLLVIAYEHGLGIDDATRRTAAAIAGQCGQTIPRARRYDFHRRAHVNQRFLAQASRLLAGSLEQDRLMDRVVRLAVPTIADACVIFLVQEGHYEPIAAAHAEPERDALLQCLFDDLQVASHPLLDEVAVSGRPVVLPTVPDARLREVARDNEHLQLLRAYGARSILAVALQARDRTLGVMVLGTTRPGRTLDERDLPTAQDLAARAGLAIDNARAHTERRVLTQQLEHALTSRVVIEQAKGVLAERHGIGAEEAFERLRKAARSGRRPLRVVAAEVVATVPRTGDDG